jgi:subtilisin family serine protease
VNNQAHSVVLCLGLAACFGVLDLQAEETVVVEGKILVRFEAQLNSQEIESIEKEFSLQKVNFLPAISTGYYRLAGTEDQIDLIERLRKRTGVVLVEEDLLRKQYASIPNDPLYGQQWYLDSATAVHIGFASAIQAFAGTATIDVAVIDSGILYNHPEFTGKINTTWAYDYVESDTTAQDENGHGTMVASLIGAAHSNGGGIAGVCPNVRIVPIRVFDNAGRFATTTSGVLVSALQRAYDANVRVINLSLGGGGYSASELAMFDALNTRGVLAVIAAGNGDRSGIGINNDSTPTYPASYNSPNIISVMATDPSGNPTTFSNYGATSVDIAAPGANILAANVRRQTVYNDVFSGGASGWLTSTASGGTPWALNSISFYGSFTPYNASGIYKYFTFAGRQGLRAELNGFFILGMGDIVLLEVWNGTTWNYVDVLAWPGDFFLNRNLDISAFDGMTGYARISLYCDVYAYGASYTRYAEIDSIRITEVALNSSSNPEYLSVNGTSFSAPLVAGTAALLLSKNPALTVADLRTALLSTASTRGSLSGKCSTGGLLNASAALAAADAKENQKITFSSLSSKTFGDASFSLTGSSSSGLPVSYSSSNTSVATVSGGIVTIVGAGVTTITATQPGNAQYYAAPSVQQTLTINPRPLIIVADGKTKMVGANDPALTYTSSGLIAGSIITGNLVREAGESVGSYAINQGTISAGINYSIQFTSAVFSITPKALDSSQIVFTEPVSLEYSKSPKTFVVNSLPHPSATNQVILLSTIGAPDSGYGTVHNLGASGFRSVTNAGIDGVFRPHQSATLISSTGLQFNFSPSHVSANPGGDTMRPPWQRSIASTGGPTNQLTSHFSARGINWATNSLFAVPCAGLTIDLSEIKPEGKTFTKFTTYFGMHSENTVGDAAYVILLDGVFVTGERTFISSNPYSNLIQVTLLPTSRFLTIVAGDNGDNYSWDHAVFVDPKITAEPAAPSISVQYAGINGTSYGPSFTAPQAAGQYRITVTSLDPDTRGTVTRDFIISKKTLSVIPGVGQGKTYLDPEPSLSYSSLGLLEGDSITGELTREVGEDAGSYGILPGSLSAGPNYQIQLSQTSFVISSRVLSAEDFVLVGPTGQNPASSTNSVVNETYSGSSKTFSIVTPSYSNGISTSISYEGLEATSYGPSSSAPVSAGLYRVTANSTDPNLSASNSCILRLNPKPISVRGIFANVKTYDGTTSVSLLGTPAYDGLVEGESFGVVGSASGEFTDKKAGTNKTVLISGISVPTANYSLSNVVVFSSIDPKPLLVHPNAQTKAFGGTDPVFTYTSEGLLEGDVLSGSLSREAGENIGTYEITIGTLSAGQNYSITLTPANLDIQAATLAENDIEIAEPPSLVYSATPKTFLASASGVSAFIYTYTGTGLTFYGPTSEPPTNAGKYSLLASSSDPNYLGSKGLEFMILKAPLTISADPKTKTFGEANPPLTYSQNGLLGSDTLSVVPDIEISTQGTTETPGSYPIILQAGNPFNYELTLQNSTLTVVAATLGVADINIITPSNLHYDAFPKTFTATSSKATNLLINYLGTGSTTYSNVTAPINVGQYVAHVTSGDPNYTGSKSTNFQILPREVLLQPETFSKYYGEPDPEFTYVLIGKQGADSIGVDINRHSGEEIGQYQVVYEIKNLSSNYTASNLTNIGNLLIQRRPIVLTAPESLTYSKTAKAFSILGATTNEVVIRYSGTSSTTFTNSTNPPFRVGTYNVTASQYGSLGNLGIEMLAIGDPGNAADTNGLGSVGYEYQISKYEITLAQYAAFLNSVAKSDPNKLYAETMATNSAQLAVNLAQAKPVTAQTTYEDNNAAFGPQKIVNGNENDYWLAKGSNESGYLMPVSITIDLGESKNIQAVKIRNTTNIHYNDRGAKDFEVSVSTEGILGGYAVVLTGTLQWQASSFQTYSFSQAKRGRYVRITIQSAYGPYACPGLSEVEVIAQETPEKSYGINRSGSDGSYTYTVVGNPGIPITGVDPASAKSFCNWLQGGRSTNADLNNGAYFIPRNRGGESPWQMVLSEALFRIPTEDEWYKAAYYKAHSQNAGYWEYPTQSDGPPIDGPGGGGANRANLTQGIPLPIGSFAATATAYGAYDMAGNVWEMFISGGTGGGNYRGGGFDSITNDLRKNSKRFSGNTNIPLTNAGFRIVAHARSQTNQTYTILPKQLDPTESITQVRSLYNGTTSVQTLHMNLETVEGVFSGDDVAIQTSPYDHQHSFASGWTGVFDSVGPSTGQADIWATITGLSLTGLDSANYSLPVSIRKLGTIMPSFLSWSESMGLTGANAAKNADPDGDGITNAAEFVFAGDPHSSGENLIIPEATPQGFKLRWLTQNSGGYGIRVMAKTNLTSPWQYVWDEPGWSHTTIPHPTRSDAGIHEMIVPWDSPYRFFKIEADIYDIDDPTQA